MDTKQEQQQRTLTSAHYNYGKGLNAYAFSKIHDRATSEDLVQNTFMKTWTHLVKGGRIDLMKSFLYRTLNDFIADEYQKRKIASLNALVEKGFELNAGDCNGFLNFLDGKDALSLIGRLPKKYQKIIRMRYIQNLSLKEISLATNKPKNTIRMQVRRGIGKLKLLYNTPHSFAQDMCLT
jgi:RNA polymerase sigma-70 factor (ECF subfamily)